jgi:hypothetical protein
MGYGWNQAFGDGSQLPPGYEESITRDQMGEFLTGANRTVWQPKRPQEIMALMTGIANLDEFSAYNPELVQQEAQQMFFRGEGYDTGRGNMFGSSAQQLERVLKQGTAGVDSAAIASQALSVTGRVGRMSTWDARQYISTDPRVAERQAGGLGILGQLTQPTVASFGSFGQQLAIGAGGLGQLAQTNQWSLYRGADQLNAQYNLRGMEYQMPSVDAMIGFGPEQSAGMMQRQAFQRAGVQLYDQTSMMGLSPLQAGQFQTAAVGSGATGMRFAQNLANFNPTAIAQASQSGVLGTNAITTMQNRMTFDAQGQELGMATLPMFTMDMGVGSWSGNQVAGMVWGDDWQSGDTYGLRQEMVTGGMRGVQAAYRSQMAGLSAASAGISLKGAELSYAFQTGIGLGNYGTVNPVTGNQFNIPGGGIWGVQDRQRALSHDQQMWNFQYQEQSMDMQRSQFSDNQALQRRGMNMNRAFTRRGWEFADQMTDLQWGWQQEDFAEESRFMVGRQRKKAERGMDRATIMHDLQAERTQEERGQQEELWQLEDERFNQTRAHFEEQMELQEENFEKMQEFYEERKKLEDQMQELQRAMFIEQNKLQREAAGIAAAQAALAKQMADDMDKANQFAEDQAGRASYIRTTWEDTMQIFIDAASKIADILDMDVPNAPGDNGWLDPDQDEGPFHQGTGGWRQVGGNIGADVDVTLQAGEWLNVIPAGENPWNGEVMPMGGGGGAGRSGDTVVVVKIGEQEIQDYIVETIQMEM